MFAVGSKAIGPSLCSTFHTLTPEASPWTLQPLNRPIALSDSLSSALPVVRLVPPPTRHATQPVCPPHQHANSGSHKRGLSCSLTQPQSVGDVRLAEGTDEHVRPKSPQ